MVHTFLHNFPTLLHISIRNLTAIGYRQCTIVERVTTISVRIRITVPTFDGICYSSKTNAFDYFIIKTISQGFTYKFSTLRAQTHRLTTDYSLCLRSSLVFKKKLTSINRCSNRTDLRMKNSQSNLFAFISIDFWREKKNVYNLKENYVSCDH